MKIKRKKFIEKQIRHKRQLKTYRKFYLEVHKNNPLCIETRKIYQLKYPWFERCGNGGNGFINLICDDCPFRVDKK